jgi:hypothetical protein
MRMPLAAGVDALAALAATPESADDGCPRAPNAVSEVDDGAGPAGAAAVVEEVDVDVDVTVAESGRLLASETTQAPSRSAAAGRAPRKSDRMKSPV